MPAPSAEQVAQALFYADRLFPLDVTGPDAQRKMREIRQVLSMKPNYVAYDYLVEL